MFSALLSLNPPPYPFVLRFAIESPPDFLHPLKRAGELCNMHVFCEGGGVAERTHMRYRKACRLFRGTCRSNVPPMNAAFGALNGTCGSSVPPMNAAFGALNGTCRTTSLRFLRHAEQCPRTKTPRMPCRHPGCDGLVSVIIVQETSYRF